MPQIFHLMQTTMICLIKFSKKKQWRWKKWSLKTILKTLKSNQLKEPTFSNFCNISCFDTLSACVTTTVFACTLVSISSDYTLHSVMHINRHDRYSGVQPIFGLHKDIKWAIPVCMLQIRCAHYSQKIRCVWLTIKY